jgi:hypothetical protein
MECCEEYRAKIPSPPKLTCRHGPPARPEPHLTVKVRGEVPGFATRSKRGNYPEASGGNGASGELIPESGGRLVESRDLPRLAYWQDSGVCLRERTTTVPCQHRLGDILINWIWSPHQLETQLFSACSPTDRVNLMLRGFLRKSKRAAASNIRPCPIRSITNHQFFEPG